MPTKSDLMSATLVEHTADNRLAVERFISQHAAKGRGDKLTVFMPRLFSMQSREQRILGTFGLRSGIGKLYFEQYLEMPIEAALAAVVHRIVERQYIAEIGNCFGHFQGGLRSTIVLLLDQLHRECFEWVIFMGTKLLHNALTRMGLSALMVYLPLTMAIKPSAAQALIGDNDVNTAAHLTAAHVPSCRASIGTLSTPLSADNIFLPHSSARPVTCLQKA
jgi:hypothetical protein